MYYTRNGGCRVAGQSVALPCLTDCKGAEVKCKDKRSDATNGTYVESIVCGTNVLNDNTGCVKNRNNDFCRRPPFLLRSTAQRLNARRLSLTDRCRDGWCAKLGLGVHRRPRRSDPDHHHRCRCHHGTRSDLRRFSSNA